MRKRHTSTNWPCLLPQTTLRPLNERRRLIKICKVNFTYDLNPEPNVLYAAHISLELYFKPQSLLAVRAIGNRLDIDRQEAHLREHSNRHNARASAAAFR
jgi:hypothetical protein